MAWGKNLLKGALMLWGCERPHVHHSSEKACPSVLPTYAEGPRRRLGGPRDSCHGLA